MWGIRTAYRFTPTRVGNIPEPSVHRIIATVHPHACGEYVFRRSCQNYSIGSPPRVWGIYSVLRKTVRGHRFTPTRVGNILANMGRSAGLAVHPHACGEYLFFFGIRLLIFGSPPRVWGICRAPGQSQPGRRFTPTRVGNMQMNEAKFEDVAVHPHACGEYCAWLRLQVLDGRFTPTRVGNIMPIL